MNGRGYFVFGGILPWSISSLSGRTALQNECMLHGLSVRAAPERKIMLHEVSL